MNATDFTRVTVSSLLIYAVFHGLMVHAKDVSEQSAAVTVNDTYSVAPLVQDAEEAYYSSAAGGPTFHSFDSLNEVGGLNLLGSYASYFIVSEQIVMVDEGISQIVVKVSAADSGGIGEPWVDVSNAGNGYISWRLDVGSTAAGNDPIEPGHPFTLLDSGFRVFDSAGILLGNFDLTTDTSTETGLSGVAVLGNSGQDIAGVDISSIHLFWEILTEDPDAVFKDGFE